MRWFAFTALMILLSSLSQAQTSGAGDYALGGSSVMWLPRGSTLFLNPAELARVKQAEIFFTTRRFNNLSAFGISYFVPFVGTFSAGASPFGISNQYAIAFSRRIGSYHSFGLALSGFRRTEETLGMSLGGSLHFPTSTEQSGFHSGFSVVSVSDQTNSPFFSANVGLGYWIISDVFRLQAAYRHTPAKNFGLAGAEVIIIRPLAVQMGTRSFEDVSGGISLSFPFGSIALSSGKAGMILSVHASLSRPAAAERSSSHELGQAAFDEERYFEASEHFLTALEYDPHFLEARLSAEQSDSLLDALVGPTLAKAREDLEKKRFLEATQGYSRVLRMTSGNPEARSALKGIQPQMESYYNELITAGDSLRDRREIEKARRNYLMAIELDPGNDSLELRIAGLKEAARSNVRSLLNRGNSFLSRGLLDEAQREFERVLAIESRNARALQGLETVQRRRLDETLQKGIEAFNESNYMTALDVFLAVLAKNPRHREAENLLTETRRILKPAAENLFRVGLQFYTKDNFRAAIQEWDKALLIDPQHAGTLEYKKRAEEKLQALEKLK